jgi:hypothetical protein
MKMTAKTTKPLQKSQTVSPGNFPLGSLASRAAARALAQLKREDKMVVLITNYSREPDHAPELTNSFSDEEGKVWEVWNVPTG